MYSILSSIDYITQFAKPSFSFANYIVLPTADPAQSYFYKGSLPSARGLLVGFADILSTIHPNYVLVSAVFIMTFLALYIKAKYPFWNQVPALHVYDWHRRNLYSENPYIVHRLPKKTKYYVAEPVIQTSRFSEFTSEKQMELVKLLQNHYLASDRVFCSIQLPDLAAQCAPSLISTYNSVVEDIAITEIHPLDASSTEMVEKDERTESDDNNGNRRIHILSNSPYIDFCWKGRQKIYRVRTGALYGLYLFQPDISNPEKDEKVCSIHTK